MIVFAICDDEPIFARQLQTTIHSFAQEHKLDILVDVYHSPNDLIKQVNKKPEHYDIYFLDIIMKPLNGIQCAEIIRTVAPDTPIVFVTSSPDFALQGYHVSARHYILKPLQQDQIHDLLSKSFLDPEQYITLHLGHSNYKSVKTRDIVYIESQGRKITYYFKNGDTEEIYGKILTHITQLPQYQFAICHQSYIVNFKYIKSIDHLTITLFNQKELPISRRKKEQLVQDYLRYVTTHIL